jgi:WD40 repeat protein
VLILDSETHDIVARLEGHEALVRSARFSADGKRIVTVSEDGSLRIWDADTARQLFIGWDPVGGYRDVCFSRSGYEAISASSHGALLTWDASKGEPHSRTQLPNSGYSLAWSPDGREMAIGCRDAWVLIWDVERGLPVRRLPGPARTACLSVAYSPDGSLLATSMVSGEILVWRTDGYELYRHLKRSNDETPSIVFLPDGRGLAVGDDRGGITCWDIESRTVSQRWESDHGSTRFVVLDPRGEKIISGHADGHLLIRDAITGEVLIERSTDAGIAFSGAFSEAGDFFATCSTDGAIRVWDPEDWSPMKTIEGSSRPCRTIAISPDGTTIVSGDEDNFVRAFSVESGAELYRFQIGGWVCDLEFDAEGDALFVLGDYGQLHLIDASGKYNPLDHLTSGQIELQAYVRELRNELWVPSEMRRAIEESRDLDDLEREAALSLVATTHTDAQSLATHAWAVLCTGGHPSWRYDRAVLQLRAAKELLPLDVRLPSFFVAADLRTGDAGGALERCEKLIVDARRLGRDPSPWVLALEVLALRALGRDGDAEERRAWVRTHVVQAGKGNDGDFKRLLAEGE